MAFSPPPHKVDGVLVTASLTPHPFATIDKAKNKTYLGYGSTGKRSNAKEVTHTTRSDAYAKAKRLEHFRSKRGNADAIDHDILRSMQRENCVHLALTGSTAMRCAAAAAVLFDHCKQIAISLLALNHGKDLGALGDDLGVIAG